MQTGGAAGHIEHHGARVTAQRRAVVRGPAPAGRRREAGRDPLDVVTTGIEPIHPALVRNRGAGRAGGIADDSHVHPLGRISVGDQDSILADPVAPRLDLKEGDIRRVPVGLDPDDAGHRDPIDARVAILVAIIDGDLQRIAEAPGGEGEAVGTSLGDQLGDVPIGDHRRAVHQPAGPHVVGAADEVGHVDAAHQRNDRVEGRGMRQQPIHDGARGLVDPRILARDLVVPYHQRWAPFADDGLEHQPRGPGRRTFAQHLKRARPRRGLEPGLEFVVQFRIALREAIEPRAKPRPVVARRVGCGPAHGGSFCRSALPMFFRVASSLP